MNAQLATRLAFTLLIYTLLQVFVLKQFILFDYAFCFLYIGALLRLPQSINTTFLLIIGFVTGLIVDVFYNTTGMHAAACVAIMFIRNSVVKGIFPTRGLETEITFSLNGMGLARFAQYIVLMATVHHIILFSIEANTTTHLYVTIIKIAGSVLFTSAMIILIQYLQRD